MDQNRISGVIYQLNKSGFGEHIYCVLCGRMTPDQKRIVRESSKVDTQLFIAIMTWFEEQSGHPGFSNTAIPNKCPQLLLIEDKESTNNTENPYDKTVKTMYEGGTYYFHRLKILPRVHLYMGLLRDLLWLCFSILHQHY
jgi:hypothetical protein